MRSYCSVYTHFLGSLTVIITHAKNVCSTRLLLTLGSQSFPLNHWRYSRCGWRLLPWRWHLSPPGFLWSCTVCRPGWWRLPADDLWNGWNGVLRVRSVQADHGRDSCLADGDLPQQGVQFLKLGFLELELSLSSSLLSTDDSETPVCLTGAFFYF